MNDMQNFLCDRPAIVFSEANRKYLTGFCADVGILTLYKDEKVLYVDGRYFEAAKNESFPDVTVKLLEKWSDTFQKIETVFSGEILTETEISVKDFNIYNAMLKSSKLIASDELSAKISDLRSRKTEKELGYIKTAQSYAEKAFLDVLDFIKVGVSEKEIAAYLEYRAKMHGTEEMAFKTIAISGKNTSMPHGVPSDKLVEAGDFITMDFGCTENGYCSDMTRTVAVNFANDEMIKVYETVLKAGLEAEKTAKAGISAKTVDSAARKVIAEAGYGEYFTHSTGHGVGIEVHEDPNVSPKNDTVLSVGNVITDEPGIYMEGKFGVRIEDMLYIGENYVENLTNSQKNLIILK